MLIDCHECGAKISASALSCPHCGAPPAAKEVPKPQAVAKNPARHSGKPTNKWVIFAILGTGFIAFLSIIAQIPSGAGNGSATAIAARSDMPSASESGEPKLTKSGLAALAVASLKRSLRNPDSLSLEDVLVDDEAKHVCITYRAQNGFGGLNAEHVVFTEAGGDQSARAWNRHCAHKQLDDEKSAATSLADLIH